MPNKFENMEADPTLGILGQEQRWTKRGTISTSEAGAAGLMASHLAARKNKRPYGSPESLSNLG
jgi:hypothetical protein